MYNKEAGESADPQGLEGGLQTEAPHQRRAIFPAPAPTAPAPGPSEAPSPRLNITVAPFTGGPFEVRVARGDTVEDLKKLIARRLKVAKERIYLLYRERWAAGETERLPLAKSLYQCNCIPLCVLFDCFTKTSHSHNPTQFG